MVKRAGGKELLMLGIVRREVMGSIKLGLRSDAVKILIVGAIVLDDRN